MGINYSFYLKFGFSIKDKVIEKWLKPYKKIVPEEYHYEDRYDTKTGEKLSKVKITDKKGYSIFIVEGQEFEGIYDLVNESSFLEDKFNCEVSCPFDCCDKVDWVNFSISVPKVGAVDAGKFSLDSTEINLDWIEHNKHKILKLKNELERTFAVDLGSPKIFFESHIG